MKRLITSILLMASCAFGIDVRYNTQKEYTIGPIVDATDAITPEVDFDPTTADEFYLLKANGAAAVDANAATFTDVVDCNGWYDITLTTSHTDTLGQMTLVIQDDDVCAPMWVTFRVINQHDWDVLYSTDVRDVSITQIAGTAIETPGTAGLLPVDVNRIDNNTLPTGIENTFDNIDDTTTASGTIADEVVTHMDANSVPLSQIGTAVALDSGTATIAGMLTKMADDNAGADFDAGTDSLQELRDRGDAAWTTGSGAGVLSTTVATEGSTNRFTMTAGKQSTNAYLYQLISVTDADDSNEETRTCIYYSSGRICIVEPPFSFTPAAGDTVKVERAVFKPQKP